VELLKCRFLKANKSYDQPILIFRFTFFPQNMKTALFCTLLWHLKQPYYDHIVEVLLPLCNAFNIVIALI